MDTNITNEARHENAGNLVADLNTNLSDFALAKLFIERHGQDLRYVAKWKKWAVWGGEIWEKDNSKAYQKLMDFITKVYIDGGTEFVRHQGNCKHQNDIVTFIRRIQNGTNAEKILTFASRFAEVQAEPDDFDADPWLLVCQNATINLAQGRAKLKGSKSRGDGLNSEFAFKRHDMVTMRAAVSWDRKADCPLWLDHLDLVFAGDQELIDYVQCLWGYSMVGMTDECIMPFAFGDGNNGKSVCWNTISGILGDYAGLASAEMLMPRKEVDLHQQANLYRKRFVSVGEPSSNQRIAAGKIKELTGDDRVTCRRLYENEWSFTPSHTFWCSTNHKPNVNTTDFGIWRRLKMIPFVVDISVALEAKGRKLDKHFLGKLKAEWPGIFKWLVDGAKRYKRDGLIEPKAVTDATIEYRDEEDTFKAFCSENLIVAPGLQISVREAFGLYQSEGGRLKRLGFKRKMLEVNGVSYSKALSGGNKFKYCFFGIGSPREDWADS